MGRFRIFSISNKIGRIGISSNQSYKIRIFKISTENNKIWSLPNDHIVDTILVSMFWLIICPRSEETSTIRLNKKSVSKKKWHFFKTRYTLLGHNSIDNNSIAWCLKILINQLILVRPCTSKNVTARLIKNWSETFCASKYGPTSHEVLTRRGDYKNTTANTTACQSEPVLVRNSIILRPLNVVLITWSNIEQIFIRLRTIFDSFEKFHGGKAEKNFHKIWSAKKMKLEKTTIVTSRCCREFWMWAWNIDM